MSYEQKYLKYKQKYLDLKKQYDMLSESNDTVGNTFVSQKGGNMSLTEQYLLTETPSFNTFVSQKGGNLNTMTQTEQMILSDTPTFNTQQGGNMMGQPIESFELDLDNLHNQRGGYEVPEQNNQNNNENENDPFAFERENAAVAGEDENVNVNVNVNENVDPLADFANNQNNQNGGMAPFKLSGSSCTGHVNGPTVPTTPVPTSIAVPQVPAQLTTPPPVPTTVPTTVAPTTQAPTTMAPTTSAPTTVAPTTVAPTTMAPTTAAPTTAAPTTVAPTTVAPTTVAPEVPQTGGSENINEITNTEDIEKLFEQLGGNLNDLDSSDVLGSSSNASVDELDSSLSISDL